MKMSDADSRLARLDRISAIQRLLMAVESLWWKSQHGLMVAGAALTIIAAGIASLLPATARLALAVAAGAALVFALRHLRHFRFPTRLSALRRMEHKAGIIHRRLSSAGDVMVPEHAAPVADNLWEEHKRRQLVGLDHLPLDPPRAAWRSMDPLALRVPVLLLAVAALALGPGTLLENFKQAVHVEKAPPLSSLALDAWLKPPGYTGRPPLLLTSPAVAAKMAAGEAVTVPEGSVFSLRISGALNPGLHILENEGKEAVLDPKALTRKDDGTLVAETVLTRPVTIVVGDGGSELGRWPVQLLPDAAPRISLTGKPAGSRLGELSVAWQASDDYGLKSVSAAMILADEQPGGEGFESNGVFLFEPPELKVTLRRPGGLEEKTTSRFALAEHPWAGLNVVLTMQVKDAAGQEGVLSPVVIRLPERVFSKALPRALVEQRKQLILFPERAGDVSRLISALISYPLGLFDRSGYAVALAAVASRLNNATGYEDVHEAIDGLWKIAVMIEDGTLADARSELQALRQELEKALREGAPQERIAELMDKLRSAMNRYLDAMRQEAERRLKDGTLKPGQQGEGRNLSREDLNRMLDALEEMSKGGSRDLAQQMLDELDRLLQNLEPGANQQADEGGDELRDMMNGLSGLMGKQKGLMDETQRQPGPDGFEQEGEEGQGGQGEGMDGLAQRQGDIRKRLDGLREGSGGMRELDDAARDMQAAEDALRNGNRDEALQRQGSALDKLRKGAREIARQMREQPGSNGEAQNGAGRSGRDDPLGRPRATRDAGTGPNNPIVPNEQALQRAREILDRLRAKAGAQGLTDGERAYIERLLRGLY